MTKILVLALLFVHGFFFVKSENKLLAMVIENLMECITQAPENLSMETCQEMIRDGNDNSLDKYRDCKCLGACAAKRMELISDKGEGNLEKLKSYISMIESEIWAKEANAVMDKCKGIKNKNGDNCDYAFQWMNCSLTNSKLASELIKTVLGDVKKSEDREMN